MRDLRDLAAFSGLVVVCGALAGTPRGGLCVAPNGRYDAITIHEFYEIENGAASTELAALTSHLHRHSILRCRSNGGEFERHWREIGEELGLFDNEPDNGHLRRYDPGRSPCSCCCVPIRGCRRCGRILASRHSGAGCG